METNIILRMSTWIDRFGDIRDHGILFHARVIPDGSVKPLPDEPGTADE